MTAGSGIIHQEMPRGDNEGRMEGFQLWANLPRSHKMMQPRYRDIKKSQVPEVALENGVKVKVICGKVGKYEGPVRESSLIPNTSMCRFPPTPSSTSNLRGHTVFAYVIEGQGYFDETKTNPIANGSVCLYGDGNHIPGYDRRGTCPVPAHLGQTYRRTGGVARPDRDEHR